MFRRWYLIILVIAIAWSGYKGYQWHTLSSGLASMSATANDATIVRIDKRKESSRTGRKGRRKTTTYYRPVIEFEDSDHIEHTAKSLHESANSSLHLKGDTVSVLYDPYDADSGCIIVGEEEDTKHEARGKLISAVGLLVTGLVFAGIGFFCDRAVDKAYGKTEQN